ncbi:hypothetical protein HYT23_06250 [Candidatus Pacearchaeota archaeon]|nr:hypothetical protein [Candidatus Pacearchaeota archaeon]
MEKDEIAGRRYIIKCGFETYLAYVVEVKGVPDYGILGVLSNNGDYPLSRVFHREVDGKREMVRLLNPKWEIENMRPSQEDAILQIPKKDLEFLLGEELVEYLSE